MRFCELEHTIRAACAILETNEIIIVGSQAILGFHRNLSGPTALSTEVDMLPVTETLKPGILPEFAADLINGNIGEGTEFENTHQYMAEGVVEGDLSLPPGWRNRTKPVCTANTNGCTGHCIDPYDMCTAKLAAGRDKDRRAIVNLIRQGVIKPGKLRKRVLTLEQEKIFDYLTVKDLAARLARWEKEASSHPPEVTHDFPTS